MQEKFWKEVNPHAKQQGIISFFENQKNIESVWMEFGPEDWSPLVGKDGAIGFPITKDAHEFIALSTFIKHLIWLIELRAKPGIDTLKASLRNKSQCLDTLFEIKSAYFSAKALDFSGLAFSPSIVNAKGKTKQADFKFTFRGVEFFCECKKKGEGKTALESRAFKLMEIIHSDLENAIPGDFRAEVYFQSLPSTYRTSLKGDLADAAKTLAEDKYYEGHVLEEAGTGRKTILYVRPKTMPQARKIGLTVGYFGTTEVLNPIRNHSQAKILVSVENPRAPAEVAKLIKEANDQLPANSPGIIFVQVFEITSDDAAKIAKAIIEDKKYINIACIVIECQLFNVYVCVYSSNYPLLLNFFDKKF